MRGHDCRMCGEPEVPVFRFACGPCYKSMPSSMQRLTAAAWKYRLSDPDAYWETVALVLQWRRDQRADRYLFEKGGS
jgi:hypothetical protein